MKLAEKIIKLALAIGAVAGVVFLIAKYMGALKDKQTPACELEEEVIEETVPVESVEETAEVAAPAAEEVVIEEGTPVAEDTDFAE